MSKGEFHVREIGAPRSSELQELASVLLDCVSGGASVSFMQPLSLKRALTFWREVAADVAAGRRALWVARDDLGICGTVQLVLAQPDNQPHRADLAKMLVCRRARQRGVGAALLEAAETGARARGKRLLVLDTANDVAERLYERAGWVRVGAIPDFALLPQGGLCHTTIYYRRLERTPSATARDMDPKACRVEVAPVDFADWTGLQALLQQAYSDMQGRIDPPSSLLGMGADELRAKAQRETLVVAFFGEDLVGCGFADWRAGALYVSKLAVRDTARRRGVARAILKACEALACAAQREFVELETRIELVDNHRTFHALGFVKVGEFNHPVYDRPTSIRLRKSVRD